MRRMIVMLTTVLLLGSASVAPAECASVLWERFVVRHTGVLDSQSISPARWIIQGSFKDEDSCALARDGAYKAAVVHLSDDPQVIRIEQHLEKRELYFFSQSLYENYFHAFRFLCLPDTIDPREKK